MGKEDREALKSLKEWLDKNGLECSLSEEEDRDAGLYKYTLSLKEKGSVDFLIAAFRGECAIDYKGKSFLATKLFPIFRGVVVGKMTGLGKKVTQ